MSRRKNRTKINFGWPNVCSRLSPTLDEPISSIYGKGKANVTANFTRDQRRIGVRRTPETRANPEGQKIMRFGPATRTALSAKPLACFTTTLSSLGAGAWAHSGERELQRTLADLMTRSHRFMPVVQSQPCRRELRGGRNAWASQHASPRFWKPRQQFTLGKPLETTDILHDAPAGA